jgi:hypothetical protein
MAGNEGEPRTMEPKTGSSRKPTLTPRKSSTVTPAAGYRRAAQ